MSKREQLRVRYIDGWYAMDGDMLLATTTNDFVFDDPAEPAPITKDKLIAYMPVWPDRIAPLGGTFEFEITDKVVQDSNGILTEWCWWKLAGIPVVGSALIKTSDAGVMYEGITYFQSPWPLRA